ncbi:unnamed protein product [Phytophthora lilii]|uniref:DNA-directed DNA polymerase n=1 Tax=Phytophthora lilii TaxID=2077276 RepID=A0A9W6TVM9_9STRA|nr:unnamed protein product [Phytophthora lilii]
MTLDHLDTLLQKQKYLCGLCYCQLTVDTASADRVNNKIGHIDSNILVSCSKCNTARKGMSLKGFCYKKLLEFNSDRLVRGGKLCKKIIGYDANALYLWALGNEMPCGRLTTIEAYDGIVEDIIADKIFGFLECDILTPDHLKDYFSEMTLILKNTLIDCADEIVIGHHMYKYNEERKQSRAKPARKLIGSYFGEKILIYAPLLKWYISHGLNISKTYCFIKASTHKAFDPFMEAVSNARREGNADKSKAMIAEMMKLVGNSAFGRSGMNNEQAQRGQVAKFDRPTPGLFKEEWRGNAMVSLSSKNYICYLPDDEHKVKVSAKGIQQGRGRNVDVLNPDGFETVRFQDQKKWFDGFKIASHNPNSWQMDLAFWEKRPILTAININSRLGNAKLLLNKTAATVLAALKAFVHLHTVDILASDNGSEFMSYNNEPGDHGTMGKIERFNKTLKQRLTKKNVSQEDYTIAYYRCYRKL